MNGNQERLHALDAVRAFALLLGIVLHGAMSFMPGLASVGWPIVDQSQSVFLQGVFYVIHVFRMTMFFAIAGFFAHLLFHRRGLNGFIRDRARRVLIPLVVGWLIVAPAVIGVFIWAVWGTPAVAAPPAAPETTLYFPLMHLWFLYVLLLIYAVVVTARTIVEKLDRGSLRTHIDGLVAGSMRWHLAPFVLALPVATALYFHSSWIAFTGIPTPDMSLIPNLPAFVAYLTAFSFGWLLHRQTALLAILQRVWPAYLGFASALTATAFWMLDATVQFAPGDIAAARRIGYVIVYAVATWAWTFAIVGAAMRFLSAHRPAVRYLADASYWVYLAHLPLIFALQELMSDWPLHWSIKFPSLIAIATALLLASYGWFVRSTYIGEILNGRRYGRNGITPQRTAEASVAVASTSRALAELRNVQKHFDKTVALDGLDLEVGRGELIAVLGPNGAGKSTAIGLLLGLQQPDSGTVTLFGESPESLHARRQTGVMMQEVALAPELRVYELIELTASYYAAPMTPDAAMQMTHTTTLAQRPYGKLSGGQKRQVQFAMAICGRPQLLFLDEPTVGLDIGAREMMWNTIRQLVRGGCSVVLTTHYLEEAEALADRVIVIAKGKVIASGSVNDMRALVSRRRVHCITSTPVQQIQTWPEVDAVIQSDDRLQITTAYAEAVVRRLLAADDQLRELEVRRAGLSEAFTELTQEAA